MAVYEDVSIDPPMIIDYVHVHGPTWTRTRFAANIHAMYSRANIATMLRGWVVTTSGHSLNASTTCLRAGSYVSPFAPVSMNFNRVY